MKYSKIKFSVPRYLAGTLHLVKSMNSGDNRGFKLTSLQSVFF